MENNTTNNVTADSTILDMLMDNIMVLGGVAFLVALFCAVAWMRSPVFRLMVRKQYAKFMRAHKDEMEELYEKYLTKAMKAKLDLQQQAVVKAAILEKAILAEVDHRAKNIEKDLTREIREIAKKL
jgi:hypothetical protein